MHTPDKTRSGRKKADTRRRGYKGHPVALIDLLLLTNQEPQDDVSFFGTKRIGYRSQGTEQYTKTKTKAMTKAIRTIV